MQSTLFALLLLVASQAWCQQDEAKWVECRSTDECVIAVGRCGCPVAINRKYLEFADRIGPIDTCSKGCDYETLSKDAKVVCAKHRCEVVRP